MNDDVKATKVDLFYKNIQAIIGMLTERGMKAEASIASGGASIRFWSGDGLCEETIFAAAKEGYSPVIGPRFIQTRDDPNFVKAEKDAKKFCEAFDAAKQRFSEYDDIFENLVVKVGEDNMATFIEYITPLFSSRFESSAKWDSSSARC